MTTLTKGSLTTDGDGLGAVLTVSGGFARSQDTKCFLVLDKILSLLSVVSDFERGKMGLVSMIVSNEFREELPLIRPVSNTLMSL